MPVFGPNNTTHFLLFKNGSRVNLTNIEVKLLNVMELLGFTNIIMADYLIPVKYWTDTGGI
jgi:hypothetical protein